MELHLPSRAALPLMGRDELGQTPHGGTGRSSLAEE